MIRRSRSRKPATIFRTGVELRKRSFLVPCQISQAGNDRSLLWIRQAAHGLHTHKGVDDGQAPREDVRAVRRIMLLRVFQWSAAWNKAASDQVNGDPVHDLKKNLELEARLKTWMDNKPVYLMLQWFDTVEKVGVSSKLLSRRWTTEITQRDGLFLDRLGRGSRITFWVLITRLLG